MSSMTRGRVVIGPVKSMHDKGTKKELTRKTKTAVNLSPVQLHPQQVLELHQGKYCLRGERGRQL